MVQDMTPEQIEAARIGCGLHAARFACRYVRPEQDPQLYKQVYDIFWDYFHR